MKDKKKELDMTLNILALEQEFYTNLGHSISFGK